VSERGSVTFWVLGLAFALMSLGVLSVDLWALIAERRELASLADAAASAAAGAVDETEWRQAQNLTLHREEASNRAWRILEVGIRIDGIEAEIEFDVDGVTVRVSLTRRVETALLGLAGRDVVEVGAASEARAVLRD
jgi:Flp pilus assembly protein TadG